MNALVPSATKLLIIMFGRWRMGIRGKNPNGPASETSANATCAPHPNIYTYREAMTDVLVDAMRFYYENMANAYPPHDGWHKRWVLSEETVRAISKVSPMPIDDDDPIPSDVTLCGCPIRIDETVKSFSYEWA